MLNRLIRILFLLPAVAAAGCYGQIFLDNPEVFSRERLLKRRSAEVAYLENKLNGPDPSPRTQGLRDVRTLTALIATLRAGFDPLQGAVATGEAVGTLAN